LVSEPKISLWCQVLGVRKSNVRSGIHRSTA
jgi:hypothetical protein